MIPIDQCEEGYLYKLHARNIAIGVYRSSPIPSFVGIRTKFSSRYLDVEYHHDADPRFGTAVPLERLEKCPVAELETDLGLVCKQCDKPMRHEGTYGNISHVHVEPTECPDTWGWLKSNKPLFEYLDEAQKRLGVEDD